MRRHLTKTIDVHVWVVYVIIAAVVIEDVGDHDWLGLAAIGVGGLLGLLLGLWQRRTRHALGTSERSEAA